MTVSEILSISLPLLGVVIGGLLTLYAGSVQDNRRWRQDQKNRYNEKVREAALEAIKWMDPFRSAYFAAEYFCGIYVVGGLPRERLDEGFPRNLGGELAKLDVPPEVRLFLPEGAYDMGHALRKRFEKLYSATLMAGPGGDFEEVNKMLATIHSELNHLEDYLAHAIKSTYEV